MSTYEVPDDGTLRSMWAIHKSSGSLCLMTDGDCRGVVVVGRESYDTKDGVLIAAQWEDFDWLPTGTLIKITV